MKKIIAAAVATAFVAPAFAADVKLSGDVEYTFTSQGVETSGATGDADLKVTATEELANGMSIMAYVDIDDYDFGDQSSRASKLELSGSFGKLEIGKDSGEAIGEYDEVADVADAGAGATLNDGFSSQNSVVFHPNTGIEGLRVAISYAAKAAQTTASAENTSMSAAVAYDFGGVEVFYGTIDKEGAAYNASIMGASGTFGPIYVGFEKINNPHATINSSRTSAQQITDAGEKDSLTNMGVTYNYGNGKLFFETNDYKDDSAATADTTRTAYGVSYNLGSTVNTYIAVADESTNNVDLDQKTVVGIKYAF